MLSAMETAADLAHSPPTEPPPRPAPRAVTVEIVIPVYNEERGLEASVRTLLRYLGDNFPFSVLVTIADNASTDGTWQVASRLAAQLDGLRAVHLDQKGRGRALRHVWMASQAEVVAYMDVDLSTGLDALLPLVAPILSGHSDVAIGSRLTPGATVVRGPKRELISRLYNLVIRATVHKRFSDAQCGFKAIRTDVARRLLPLVEDGGWFFDTELLVLAEHNGLRIHEVPVDWVDDPDSRVDVVRTAAADLRGLWRVGLSLARGGGRIEGASGSGRTGSGPLAETVRYAGVGGLSTLAFAVLFCVLHPFVGGLMADSIALTVCAVGNFLAHWRLTFGAGAGRRLGSRLVLSGLAAFLAGLVLSRFAVGLAGSGAGGTAWQLLAAMVALACVSVVRFVVLRGAAYREILEEGATPAARAARLRQRSGR
jgi:putative flippase GtrA